MSPIINFIWDPTELNKKKVDPNIEDLEDYFLDNTGILFKNINDSQAQLRTDEEVLVIPHKYQKAATSIIHDSALGGHSGYENTTFAVRRRFFWRNMKYTIKKYVDSCKTCLLNKGRPHPKQPQRK